MSKTLEVTLSYLVIKEAVKGETYISSQTEKLADGSNTAKVFNESAGDDALHEHKLQRTLRGALGSLEAFMVDFVDNSEGVDSIKDTLNSDTTDSFTVSFKVNSRFNEGLSWALGQLMQEYIINKMLTLWWAAVPDRKNDVNQYLQLANESLSNIRKCLQKTAPDTAKFVEADGKIVESSTKNTQGEPSSLSPQN